MWPFRVSGGGSELLTFLSSWAYLNISQKRGWFKITKRQVGNIHFCPFPSYPTQASLSFPLPSIPAPLFILWEDPQLLQPQPAVRKQQGQLTWHLKESTLQKSLEDENMGTEVISRCCSHNPHLLTELVLKQSQTCLVLSPQVLFQCLL